MDGQRGEHAPWWRRAVRAALLGLALSAALAVAGLIAGLVTHQSLLRAVMWAEFGGGTVVAGVGSLLLLWRPKEAGRVAERERTATVGFGVMLSGALALGIGLWISWAFRL